MKLTFPPRAFFEEEEEETVILNIHMHFNTARTLYYSANDVIQIIYRSSSINRARVNCLGWSEQE